MEIYKFLCALVFFIGSIQGQKSHNSKTECSSHDDPHMTTFDGVNYEFQYRGDHFIMYEDFKDTRVTAGYQPCGSATCNCAAYLKKGRKIVFVDFCGVTNDRSPTSQFYGVHLEKNSVGLKAIKKMPPCKVINAKDEDTERVWNSIPTFLGVFKCAILQGSNHYTQYVLRTVEKHFEDSVKVKVRLATRSLPQLGISPAKSSFQNTGGLCGMWDNDRKKELFVLDQDGVEDYLPNLGDVTLARDFWKLASRYNKDVNEVNKRCPECYTVSERSFYCPCDEFDMFDITNYNIPFAENNRTSFCKVPMYHCIEKFTNVIDPTDPYTTTKSPDPSTTTRRPPTIEESFELCLEGFLEHPQLGPVIENGCLDVNRTLELCAIDVYLTGDLGFIIMHIQNLIDTSIQNILTAQENCNDTDITTLCPNGCSNNGVCIYHEDCIQPERLFFDNDDDVCASPVKCDCYEGFGGKDCSIDLTDITDFQLDRDCCDLRNEKCDEVDVFGYPFSVRDKVYAKIELVEVGLSTTRTIESYTIATTFSESNVLVRIDNLDQLTLFKYINDLPTDFVLKESTAVVNIYLSYKNSTFEKVKSFKLYDSKCRSCNKNTQATSLLSNKCEIEGKCYANMDASPNDVHLVCKPEFSIFTWTDVLCYDNYGWSEWYNLDDPSGDGDIETTELLGVGCKNPSRLQAKTVDDVPSHETGQKVFMDTCYGFICLNKENESPCLDYVVRKCCPK